MPEIADFEKALPDNVAMLTVCLDGYGNEDSVKEVLENAGFEGVTLITGLPPVKMRPFRKPAA